MAGVAGGSGVPLSPKSGEHRSGRESTAVNGLLFLSKGAGFSPCKKIFDHKTLVCISSS